MKQEFKNQFSYAGVMDRIKNEYKELVRNFPLSLKKNVLLADFHFDEFCKDFSPHSQVEKIIYYPILRKPTKKETLQGLVF